MLLLLFILFFTAYHIYLLSRRAKLPPGPSPIHLLGNLPQLALQLKKKGSLTEVLRAYQQEYGDIFTLWLGPMPTVHIASMELAHEFMIKQGNTFADRWAPLLFNYLRDGKGIISSNGDYWQEQRRFTLQTLRGFGMGKNLIEERIMLEFDLRSAELDEKIKNNVHHTENSKTFFDFMVGSIINRLLFSERFTESNQEEFTVLKNQMDELTNTVGIVDILIKPWMLKLPYVKEKYAEFLKPMDNLLVFVKHRVNERKEAIKKGDHIIVDDGNDYVDAYLKKIESENGSPNSSYTERSLLINLLDLWAAGQETTTTTLVWGLNYLLHHPEITEKVRKEIHSVTSNSRALSLKDKNDTPYFNATINEIHRHAAILTVNLFRQAREKTSIRDFVIEPGVPITAELSLIMSDEKDFKNTHEFNPERYLETEKLEQKVIPFGIGKRACPGESLARAEIYLLLGNMISKYDFKPVGKLPSMKSPHPAGLFKFSDQYSVQFAPLGAEN